MKALVKKFPEKGLWMEDVPEPVTGTGDVKIKIRKTAICGTDLHIYNWDEWSQKTIETPRIIGHEYVGEIAAHFFYSREYVSRLFKKYYDTTILDYIHKLRISKSRALIAEGMPMIDVCYAVGFSSLSTFIRAFRAATDMTPSEYRKIVRE